MTEYTPLPVFALSAGAVKEKWVQETSQTPNNGIDWEILGCFLPVIIKR